MPADMRKRDELRRMNSFSCRFMLLCVVTALMTLFTSERVLLQQRQKVTNGLPKREGFIKTSQEQEDLPTLLNFETRRNVSREEAIQQYRERFTVWRREHQTTMCHDNKSFPVNLTSMEKCGIRPGAEHRTFQYPENAEDHFVQIHLTLAEWGQHHAHQMHTAANYSGPWIENYWIETFLAKTLARSCLAETFDYYIPLFIPWVDLWVGNNFHYPHGFVDTLLGLLLKDVAYVTVSQSDLGLSGYRELPMKRIPNVLVLSAGGYGHVPIPLFKKDEAVDAVLHPKDRPHTVVYTGSLEHAPNNLRLKMHKDLIKTNFSYVHYYGPDWRSVMRRARFNLVPRGYGRSAYHLMETVQSNLIPIYVYSDEPWIPYQEIFDLIGYQSSFQDLPALLETLQNLPHSHIVEKEKRIATLRNSHFSYTGIMLQIELFFRPRPTESGRLRQSDLRCQGLPKNPR